MHKPDDRVAGACGGDVIESGGCVRMQQGTAGMERGVSRRQ